jgi:hypothetical protein
VAELAEGGRLLTCYMVLKPYQGFESLPLRMNKVNEKRASQLLDSWEGFEGRDNEQRPGLSRSEGNPFLSE